MPSRRRVGVVAAGAVVQLVCAGSFVAVGAADGFRTCAVQPAQPAANAYGNAAANGDEGPWLTTRTIVNAPVSGAALLYGVAKGGDLYQCTDNGTTAVVLQDGVVRAGTMFGTVFLTDQRMEADTPRMQRLSEHEARHADQWAAFSIAAGPSAFPALYALDEAVFPGAFNHFERHAGLQDGGYEAPSGCQSIAGQLTLLSLGGLTAGILVVWPRLRRSPNSARPGEAVPQRRSPAQSPTHPASPPT
ncbi:hypothetical protein [Streptomyces griseorubiginosus]|uniref:hypothetical protein n=1 Tax=Streptomyces griseorubiginosus TaxID=67304 RepID=UPI0033ED7D3A